MGVRGFLVILLLIGAMPTFAWSANSAEKLSCVDRDLREHLFGVPSSPPVRVKPISDWSQQLSDTWFRLMQTHPIPKDGVVVEVAPGSATKVGWALKRAQFHGTLYVVEPDATALRTVTAQYRALLPGATIVPVESTLDKAAAKINRHVDAILSNHPLDDMIIGKSIENSKFHSYFSNIYTHESESLEAARKMWAELESHPQDLAKIKSEVSKEWVDFVNRLQPRVLGISQHPSRTFVINGIHAPTAHAGEVLQDLKNRLGENSKRVERALQLTGYENAHWIYVERPKPPAMVQPKPDAFHLGDGVLVPMKARTLHESQTAVLGIDEDLARTELGLPASTSGSQLNHAFQTHLAVDWSGDPALHASGTTMVYADRQRDPLGLALSGNEGSGRAAYLNQHLNVKGGGRTVLAKAGAGEEHGTGRVAIADALGEMIAANSMDRNLRTGASPVLGFLDLKSSYQFDEWGKENAAELIRVDDGALDRPVHAFKSPELLKSIDLSEVAAQFGRQDAEKFIERIVHGAWSAGNISLDGRMIDFETVSSVRSRAPQFSLSGKYPDNYFGMESIGQKKILAEMAKEKGVSAASVESAFDQARTLQMQKRILDLFGMDPMEISSVLERDRPQVAKLTEEFEKLSGKMYPNFEATGFRSVSKGELGVFDFSRFFRGYPALQSRLSGEALKRAAFQLLFNPDGSLAPKDYSKVSANVKELLEHSNVVGSETELNRLKEEAESFIEHYQTIFIPSLEQTIRAYVTNEDRRYLELGPNLERYKRIADDYQSGKISAEKMRKITQTFIHANDRLAVPDAAGFYHSDVRIFENGSFETLISKTGERRFQLKLYDSEPRAPRAYEIRMGGKNYPLTRGPDGTYLSSELPSFNSSQIFLNGTLFLNSKPVEIF